MKFHRAVREALLLFPSDLSITSHERDIARSNDLKFAWERAEDTASNGSVWLHIAVWAVGCALFCLVREAGMQGNIVAHKKNIDFGYVEFKFAESLLTPNTWFPGDVKRAYKRDRRKRGVPDFVVSKAHSPRPLEEASNQSFHRTASGGR